MKPGSCHFRFVSFIVLPFVLIVLGYTHALAGKTPGLLALHFAQQSGQSDSPVTQDAPAPQGSPAGDAKDKAHMDHRSKHGGAFFMCLDNKHHLEGVLLPPGTFRLYLYDDHTKPLKAEQVREASGTVQIGDSEDAPKVTLAPGKKKETMEVALGADVKFPVALTVLLHLPGMVPDAKPELFNFTFSQFTDENGPGTPAPMGNMPGMRR